MAPLYTVAAAVCLVALSELRQVAADQTTYKLKAQDVTEDAYFAVNLARNGRLPVHIKVVAEDKELVSELTEKVNTEGAGLPARDVTEESCKPLINSENFKEMFHHAFDYSAEADAKPNYRQTLQEALKAGLALFNNKYPESPTAWAEIWENDAGASLGYLLGSNSTQIGCVIGRCTQVTTQSDKKQSSIEKAVKLGDPVETPTNKAVLLCQLKPPATKDTAPFDEDYFTGLIARTTELADMTEEDLKAPTNDGTAATAVPTVIFAGLVAMLTGMSV